MKSLLLLLLFTAACGENSNRHASNERPQTATNEQTAFDAAKWLTLADATAILGEPSHAVDSNWSTDEKVRRFNGGYKADARDQQSGDTGAIYVVFEQYNSINSAHSRYVFIHDANQHSGIRDIPGMGDEAYYHTDNTHFRFIMARKKNRIAVMKINKITSHTSDEAFRRITGRIVAAM